MDEEVEELEEIKELEEIDKVEKVEAYPQYMHPSHGLNRPQPQNHHPLSMERAAGRDFWALDVKPPL